MRIMIGLLSGLVLVACGIAAWATPPSGVSPVLLARGTYGEFKVKSRPSAPFEYEAEAKPEVDMVVRRHDYLAGGYTGWHQHPGPVFITVTQGTLTFYEYNDPFCTPHVVRTGQGYVDDGSGHYGRNETGDAAQDVSVIIAPVGQTFRTELPPSPYCGF